MGILPMISEGRLTHLFGPAATGRPTAGWTNRRPLKDYRSRPLRTAACSCSTPTIKPQRDSLPGCLADGVEAARRRGGPQGSGLEAARLQPNLAPVTYSRCKTSTATPGPGVAASMLLMPRAGILSTPYLRTPHGGRDRIEGRPGVEPSSCGQLMTSAPLFDVHSVLDHSSSSSSSTSSPQSTKRWAGWTKANRTWRRQVVRVADAVHLALRHRPTSGPVRSLLSVNSVAPGPVPWRFIVNTPPERLRPMHACVLPCLGEMDDSSWAPDAIRPASVPSAPKALGIHPQRLLVPRKTAQTAKT